MRNDFVEDLKRVFERYTIDDQIGTEGVDLVHRGETLRVVEKTHALGVHLVDGTFVVEGKQVDEERTHLSGAENKNLHKAGNYWLMIFICCCTLSSWMCSKMALTHSGEMPTRLP